ncbi:MAG: transcriptional regulator NrdR [Lachnospiraceae bacterium]|jgi:transcriptional repressor NrdR
MKCPYCGNANTKVVDSRPMDDDAAIRRRRLCENCGKRFTSYEKAEIIPLRVIKKDNNREDFDRAKIEAGIVRACHKRPISYDRIIETVDAIERDIYSRDVREIDSNQVGEIVMSYIKDLDDVAYVRFASVYREFKDVDTFMVELKELMKDKRKL